jgi:hypothetical protein
VTSTYTPTPSSTPSVLFCSKYELTVTGFSNSQTFEYYYTECDDTLCGLERQVSGVIINVPTTITICAQDNTVVIPALYNPITYNLTTICNNCC